MTDDIKITDTKIDEQKRAEPSPRQPSPWLWIFLAAVAAGAMIQAGCPAPS
jgi:hypothetical protein